MDDISCLVYQYLYLFAVSILDYSSLKLDISFAAGSKTGDEQCFTITIVNDGISEVGNEIFSLSLLNPEPLLNDIVILQPNVTVTIVDCKYINPQCSCTTVIVVILHAHAQAGGYVIEAGVHIF